MGEWDPTMFGKKIDAHAVQSRRRRSLSKVSETLTANVNTEICLKCTLHDQSAEATNRSGALALPWRTPPDFKPVQTHSINRTQPHA